MRKFGAEVPAEVIVRQLRKYSNAITNDAAGRVGRLLRSASKAPVILTHIPGWKFDPRTGRRIAFVTPAGIVGPKARRFRWDHGSKPAPILGSNVTREGWLALAALAEQSSYVGFAIMTALACPLVQFANLPESAVWHLAGPNSVGKTLCLKIAQSVYRRSEPLPHWAQTPRTLEETAARLNETLNVLNAAEKVPTSKLAERLTIIIHVIPEGQSPDRPKEVQAKYPDLTWIGFTLSSGNATGQGLSAKAGQSWDEQDAGRFITIPIPDQPQGIFDQLAEASESPGVQSAALVLQAEGILQRHYGVLWRAWVRHLLELEDLEGDLNKLIDRFVAKVQPRPGMDARIARKFGVIYAAGRLATKAGLLPWPSRLPLRTVRRLYEAARDLRLREFEKKRDVLRVLHRAASDKGLFKPAAPGDLIEITAAGTPYGLLWRLNGQEVIAVRMEALRALCGEEPDSVVKQLEEAGVTLRGHGNRRACQLRVKILEKGELIDKPRFLLVSIERLASAVGRRQLCPMRDDPL